MDGMNSGLRINNLSVTLDDGSRVISDLSLTISPGSSHVLMAPNGAGKSSLAYAIMGHPRYTVTQGSIIFNGVDLAELSVDKRARLGIFLAFQNPYALPGVTVATFIKEARQAVHGVHSSIQDFQHELHAAMDALGIDKSFAMREVNQGFSGGEKKRLEMLQLVLLKPKVAILDELDSGLDIDALKQVTSMLGVVKKENPMMSIVLITHYQRMLEYLVIDHVHIMQKGSVVRSGDISLVSELEKKGYDAFCR